MADSDEDFFLDTQLPPKLVSDSSDVSKVSVVEYFFAVTFNWNLFVGHPFQMNVLEKITDFPDHWIKGPLRNAHRLEKLPVRAFGGGQFSLFCKVEKGCIIYNYIFIFIYFIT